ncbi:protein RIC-3 isoform X2 [Tupaia chinensis]|uniref:protein RIC-3 isoform X2 n=1 Tax=Tupaia chinensis TaxID=246437 RepID=UPI0003C917BC|nr:protein RIC-3 isoform X2 [Tupaia chinensis]
MESGCEGQERKLQTGIVEVRGEGPRGPGWRVGGEDAQAEGCTASVTDGPAGSGRGTSSRYTPEIEGEPQLQTAEVEWGYLVPCATPSTQPRGSVASCRRAAVPVPVPAGVRTCGDGKLGRFPPMMHHHQAPSDGQTPGSRFQRSHLAEAFSKAKGSGGGTGGGGSGRGLMGQIIPIYGFGIFLYILYILFKLSKGKTTAEDRKFSSATPGNTHRKITNFELAQLQEKLKETEEAMEKLINRMGPNGERAPTVTSDQEKQLLHQLREITRVMKEGKFIDRPTPEKEAEEMPYMEDWEGYPEETYPIYDLSDCIKHRQETILVDYPDPKEPSAEEVAERMEVIEEEETNHLDWESLSTDPRAQEVHSATSCDPKAEMCSCCLLEEEDPAVLAENAGFSADSCSEQEEATQEEWPQDFRDEGLGIGVNQAHTGGMLRKRNPQGLE